MQIDDNKITNSPTIFFLLCLVPYDGASLDLKITVVGFHQTVHTPTSDKKEREKKKRQQVRVFNTAKKTVAILLHG